MRKLRWLCLFSSFTFSDSLLVDYQRMNRVLFQKEIVGNTIIGITRQSQSLYMLYFQADGSCELWKQNQKYCGRWWIDEDREGKDLIHAFWPAYISLEPKSLFFPQNPSYGKPTSLRYYFNPATRGVFVRGKAFQTPVLLAPGCAFPSKVER
jgi:hypothetical protein